MRNACLLQLWCLILAACGLVADNASAVWRFGGPQPQRMKVGAQPQDVKFHHQPIAVAAGRRVVAVALI